MMEYKTTMEMKTTTAVIASTYTHIEEEYVNTIIMYIKEKNTLFKHKQLYWIDQLKKEWKHDCTHLNHSQFGFL